MTANCHRFPNHLGELTLPSVAPLRMVHPRKRHEIVASVHRRTSNETLQSGKQAIDKRQECEYGTWRCQGQDLQREYLWSFSRDFTDCEELKDPSLYVDLQAALEVNSGR